MARADLLCKLIQYGLANDAVNFRKAAEAICAEERSKQHSVLANKIDEIIRSHNQSAPRGHIANASFIRNDIGEQSLFIEKMPKQQLGHLILPKLVLTTCHDIINEQNRSDLLRSFGLEPRNRILLVGPPGNGKTSLAEAIAESLAIPMMTVRYENIIGPYLGETASRLFKLFEYVKTRECLLFFDEFETLGKERGDVHETGEIKRVVSSLLMQIDSLPSYVVIVAATNHESLLDQAAWRRFQIRMELPLPTRNNLELFYHFFEEKYGFHFGIQLSTLAKKTYGLSYAEAEELALSIYRQYILEMPGAGQKVITEKILNNWRASVGFSFNKRKGEDINDRQADNSVPFSGES